MRWVIASARQLARLATVLGVATVAVMLYLGRPLPSYRCLAVEGCTATPYPDPTFAQPSLVHRLGLLVHGYWQAALMTAIVVAGLRAVVGGVRLADDHRNSEFLRRTCS